MKRLYLILLSLIMAGCGSSTDFPPSGQQGGGATPSNLPFFLLVESGRIGPGSDTFELTVVPSGETVLLGENGEFGEISTEEFLERVADGTRAAELEFESDGRTRLLELDLLDLQRQSDGSLLLSARAAEVPDSTPILGEEVRAQGVTTGAFSFLVTDTNGDELPGSIIDAVHQPTGTRYSTVTRENGRANILNARVGGPYKVSASLTGFRTQSYNNVFLKLGETLPLEFELQLDSVEELFSQGVLRVSPTN